MNRPPERVVRLYVRLPTSIADDAERIADTDWTYFQGVILAAVARKKIYEALRADEAKRLGAHPERQA